MAVMPEEELWKTFDTHPEGLNLAEVESAREQHGENKLPAQQPSPWWVHLWVCYRNPFNILLTILGAISYATEDLFAAGVIALMVAISTLLNFIQEARSTKAADALKAMVSNTATVLRVINDKGENGWLEIPIDQLVPGDIIKLAAGDMIPADLRILQARDLFVAQASLTGESLPVEKSRYYSPAGAQQSAGVRHPVFYGHHRGERHGTSNGDCYRSQHLVWSTGGAC